MKESIEKQKVQKIMDEDIEKLFGKSDIQTLITKLKMNIEERNLLESNFSHILVGEKFIINDDFYSNVYSQTGTNYIGRKCLIRYVSIENDDLYCSIDIMNMKTAKFSIKHSSQILYSDLKPIKNVI